MNKVLYSAIAYRLFASGNNPKNNFRLRTLLFVVSLTAIGYMAYKFTPHGWLIGYIQGQIIILIFLFTALLNALFFILLHPYARGSLRRLSILQLLPISRGQTLGAYFLAFLPLALLATVMVLFAAFRFFESTMPLPQLAVCIFATQTLAVIYNILLRICKTRAPAQIVGLTYLVLAFLGFRAMLFGGEAFWLAAVIAISQIVSTVFLLFRQPAEILGKPAWFVWQSQKLNVYSALATRALRTGRFLGSVCMTSIVLAGLSLAARFSSGNIPFDAMVVAVLLLAGTIAQEARGLSPKYGQPELVYYGNFKKWITSGWLLTYAVVALFAVLALVLVDQWFYGQISVSPAYVLQLAAGMAAAGMIASAIIVPKTSDVLAQMGSAAIYAILVWAAFKLLANFEQYGLLMPVFAFVLAYSLEKYRWLKIIRGKIWS